MRYKIIDYLRALTTSLWFIIALSICLVILIPGLLISFGKLRDLLVAWLGFFLGRSTLWVSGINFRIHYKGPIPREPAVFIFNHSSTLDLFIVIALWLPNIRFVAKKELLYNPLFFIAGKLTGHFFIDRKDSKKSIGMLNKALKQVKQQRLSLLFAPEGTRKHQGIIGKFKHGAFYMAHDLGYPIVPIYIEGAGNLCPGGSLLTRKGTVTAYINEPFDTTQYAKHQIPQLAGEVRSLYLKWAGVGSEEENFSLKPNN